MGNEQNKKNKKQSVKVPTAMEIKTYIMVAQNKLTLYRNKKVYAIKQKRTDIGKCLKENNLDVAKAKMDTLIREEDIITCYDILGPICEILKEKVTYLLTSNQCPPDLRAPLDTIIYSSSRLELAELFQLRSLIEMKYGQMYVSKADSNADGLVNINLVEKLRVKPAAEAFIMIRLKQLCKECKINYDFPQEIQPMDFGGDMGGGNSGGQGFNPYSSGMGGNNFQSGQFNNPYGGNQGESPYSGNNEFGNFNQHMGGNNNNEFGNFNQQMNQGGFPNNNQGGFPNNNQGNFPNNNQGGFSNNNQGNFPSNSQFGNNQSQFNNPKASNFGNPYSFNNNSKMENKNNNNEFPKQNESGFGFPTNDNNAFPPSNNPSSFGGFPNPNNNDNNAFPPNNNPSSFGGFPNPNNNNNDAFPPSNNPSSFGGFPNPNNNNNDFPSSNNNFPNPNKQSGFPNNSVAFPNSSQMGGDAFNPYASKNELESSVSDKKFVNKPGEMYKDVPNDKLPTLNSQIKSDDNNDFPNPYGQ